MEASTVVTGELRSQIDKIWNDFWSGGISNPLEVMEQLTYLLFIKRLDELQTLAENRERPSPRVPTTGAAHIRTTAGAGSRTSLPPRC